ncbi:MAG: alkaline phosphatase [Lentimicrobium sp.]
MVTKSITFKALALLVMTALAAPFFAQAQNTPPKNVIILISDGWGMNHIKATNYWHGVPGASFQNFPVQYFMSTYQGTQVSPQANPPLSGFGTGYNSTKAWTDATFVNKDYTDSAPAATTMASGVKSANSAIGVDVFAQNVELITERANELGKSSGVVTSVQWSHATPAGYATHNINRNNYSQIALTMLLDTRLSVIMGCGHPLYDDNSNPRSSGFNYNYVGGQAAWDTLVAGSNLFSVPSITGRTFPMDITGDGVSDPWTLIQDSIDFVNLANATNLQYGTRIVGTAKCATTTNQSRTKVSNLPYVDPLNDEVPSLMTMSLGALNLLNTNPNGLLLMIEGGAVDWAGHANDAARLIEEQQEFNMTVDSVIAWVEANGGWEQNLVIVTGDHETGYLTGPNYPGTDLVATFDVIDNGAAVMPSLKFNSGNHTNALIPLYAKGNGSELFERYADELDYKFGYYIDNTELGLVCKDVFNVQAPVTPKNVIYMISDGMGYNQVKAASYFHGLTAQPYENQLGVEFLKTAMATNVGKTTNAVPGSTGSSADYDSWYNSKNAWTDSTFVKFKPTDSAPAATTMYTGKKTANSIIGMDYLANPLRNFGDEAFETGKSIGVISTVQFAHATPAAFAAHNISRNNYAAIANEMLLNSKCSVIMGCGAPDFDDNGMPKTPTNYNYVGGLSTWNELLAGGTTTFTASVNGNSTVQDINGDGTPDAWTLIRDSIEFANMASGKTPLRVLGIPKVGSTNQQGRTRPGSPMAFEIPFNRNVPTLADMTSAAINVLDNNANGFAMVIEGGAIDWAGHANQMDRTIEEQHDFDKAVQAVIDWVNANSSWDETLLLITGDHECGYLVGPGYNSSNLAGTYDIISNGAGSHPGGKFISGDHTNQLLPLYIHGAGATNFAKYCTNIDKIRGSYLHNSETGAGIIELLSVLPDGTPAIIPGSIENTWTGAVSSDWFDAANWENNSIPDATTDVTIPGSVTNFPELTASASVANLTIENGGMLKGNALLSVNGQSEVQVDLGAGEFHYISSPVANPAAISAFPANTYLRRYDEPTGNWINLTGADVLAAGKGYSSWIAGGATAGFKGVLNTGSVTPAMTNQGASGNDQYDGYNLIGNPYCSSIDLTHASLTYSNIMPTAYMWDGDANQYAYYNWNTNIGANGAGQYIPSTQAFFVKSTGSGVQPAFTFTEDSRSFGLQEFYKNGVSNVIRLQVSGEQMKNEAVVMFNENASAALDNNYDAFALKASDINFIYTRSGENYDLAINALTSPEVNHVVPVYLDVVKSGNYSITASGLENFTYSMPVWFTDLKTGNSQNLLVNPVYSFSASTGDNAARFKLSFGTVGIEDPATANAGVYAENSNIHVTTPDSFSGSVKVYDMLGKLVAERQVNGACETIISLNSTGKAYLVKLISAQSTVTRKVVLN